MSPERDAAQQQAGLLFRDSLQEAGYSAADYGYELGLSGSWVEQRRQGIDAIAVRDLLAGPRRVLRPYVRRLAAMLANEAAPPSGLSHDQLLRRLTTERGDTARVLDQALVDGTITADEARAIISELLDERRLIDEWLAKLEAIRAEEDEG